MPENAADSGLELDRIFTWLSEQVPGLKPPLEARLISGGRSNLTFGLRDGSGRHMILRRPPLGELLESAHDMGREHRIISALTDTAVPVPRAVGMCEDPAVTGAPFYVMDFVDGAIVRDAEECERDLPEAIRPTVAASVVDVLADLHALEPEDVGLGSLGRREGYVERQLRRWQRQWEDARGRTVPEMDEAHRLLTEQIPPQQRVSIVHGDYRLDNLVVAASGQVAAVLDWELCTLGDPLADLGMLLLYWVRPDEPTGHLISGTPMAVPGFGDREAALNRYAERSGLDISPVPYHMALCLWKTASIAEGIGARLRSGAMGALESPEAEWFEERVPQLAQHAVDMLRANPG